MNKMRPLILLLAFICPTTRLGAAVESSPSLSQLAGDYYFGDGLGISCFLSLTDTAKFTFEWRGCLGPYDTNDGEIFLSKGILHLKPTKPNVQKRFRGTPTDFYPVRWGSRMYLVPTNQMIQFCSDVNQGSEPRRGSYIGNGLYYVRRGMEKGPIQGKPFVPEPWKEYFLHEPVRGRITELVNEREGWLDKGAADGLRPGMILTAQGHGPLLLAQVEVGAVEKRRCRIECLWKESKLALGEKVSSKFDDRKPRDYSRDY